jgi:2-C-methyl-D-erythritol 4-phosphate cytidylyltransferase
VTAQQPLRGDVAVLVPAAGIGSRLGPGTPKALREVAGAPLLVHAVRRVCRADGVGCVVVAAPPGRADEVRALLAPDVLAGVTLLVVDGGPTRADSVQAALSAAPAECPVVLVHDAARAFAPPDLVERVAAAVRSGHDAVIPVLAVVDTVKEVDADGRVVRTLDRAALRAVQTPQGFRRDVLLAAHRAGGAAFGVTDDAGLVERLGVAVFCVPGAEAALKITRPSDVALARALAQLHLDADGGRTLTS